MFKRPDSDIFGTKNYHQHAVIKNDSFIDPHQAFKKKNDQNYQKYYNKIGNVGRKCPEGNPEMTKVNQKVMFDQQYHKSRKFKDMSSSIFYEQKQYQRPQTTHEISRPLKEKSTQNNQAIDIHHGRKNTMKRQIESLPYNHSQIKGNASQLFDFDTKNQSTISMKDQPILIPHQMQWNQHDSIRYNQYGKQDNNINPLTGNQSNVFSKVEESHSAEKDRTQIKDKKITILKNNSKDNVNQSGQKKTQIAKQEKVILPSSTSSDIQIKVLKGWDNKFMQGLSKYCKLYSTPMTKFEFQGSGKATIFLKKTKKWQAVSDWLTKDAKLKIRVTNN